MNVLVIAPHGDDEVFGVGGTICRLVAEGAKVTVAIITRGKPPLFQDEHVAEVVAELKQAHKILGVQRTIFMEGFPAAMLDTIPHSQLNKAVRDLIDDVEPDIMFIPFIGDIHFDHRLVFESCLVAARPNGNKIPSRIYAYETLSETNWNAPMLSPNFTPNTLIDISDHLDTKINAVEMIKSQLKPFPYERSIEAVRALAMHRGATAVFFAAEAFVLIRALHGRGDFVINQHPIRSTL